MNEEQLQELFIQQLIAEAQEHGALTEEDVKAYINSLGEEGIRLKYAEFILRLLQGSLKASLGAKLNYYNKLRGKCPEDETLVYFSKGGRTCKKCEKAEKGISLKKSKHPLFKLIGK